MGMLAQPRVKGRHLRAKWEAVRRTRETLANQISTGSDPNIGLGMARKLMENLGWKEGQGLGASNQGLAEPVKLHQNIDSRGVGYTAKRGVEQEHHAAHYQKFESVLSALSAAHSKENKDAASAKPNSENGDGADGGGDENRPKRSRNHLHYHKFARAKDVSSYSRHDIDCVIGAKAHALYSDVLKEGQVESSDKFAVSELSSTDYFSGLQETGPNRSPEDDTDMRPGFEAGSPQPEEDAEEINDIVQKNFQKSVSNSYAACFVAADSVLPLEANDEEGAPEENRGVDVESISKKKKKKKSKKSEVSENSRSAVPFDGKQELIESELVMEEKENQAKRDMKVESAAVDNHEVDCEGTMQVENDASSLVPRKKKKKKRLEKKKDLPCHNEGEVTPLTAEKNRTEMDLFSSTQGKEQSKLTVTDFDSVETSCASATGAGNALWSKYAHLYATSFVKGEVIPGSIESSDEQPTSDAVVEEMNNKRRKKKSKRKGKEMEVDKAGIDADVREPVEKYDSKCSGDAESVSKVDGESGSSKSPKKKRKSNAIEIIDACADVGEPNMQKEDEVAEGNTATTDIDVDQTVVKKKKKSKKGTLEMCGEVRKESNGSFTEDCRDNNACNTRCSNDGFVTENQLLAATEKKKKSERGSTEKIEENILQESCVMKNDQQDSGQSKSKKKGKKSKDSGCATETVVEATDEMLLEEKSVGEHTEAKLKKKKKKKSSRSSETVTSNELEEACVLSEEGVLHEVKKRSKKRKRQETDVDEEKSVVVEDLEIKRKKKKLKNTLET